MYASSVFTVCRRTKSLLWEVLTTKGIYDCNPFAFVNLTRYIPVTQLDGIVTENAAGQLAATRPVREFSAGTGYDFPGMLVIERINLAPFP